MLSIISKNQPWCLRLYISEVYRETLNVSIIFSPELFSYTTSKNIYQFKLSACKTFAMTFSHRITQIMSELEKKNAWIIWQVLILFDEIFMGIFNSNLIMLIIMIRSLTKQYYLLPISTQMSHKTSKCTVSQTLPMIFPLILHLCIALVSISLPKP